MLIIILLSIKFSNSISFSSEITLNNNIKLANYFDLNKVDPLIFHISTCSCSIIGFMITIILFFILKRKYDEVNISKFKLINLFLFGLLVNLLQFLIGVLPIIQDNDHYNKVFYKEIKININQFLFLNLNLFTVCFGFYSFFAIDLASNNKEDNNNKSNDWKVYKIIILIYLTFSLFVYMLFLLDSCGYINFNFNKKHSNYILGLFPYFIHTLNGLLWFSFYFELKHSILVLIESNEKREINFDESCKNCL